MSLCKLKFTGERRGDRFVYVCTECHREVASKSPEPTIKATCRMPGPEPVILAPPPPLYGPGTELIPLIKEYGIQKLGCGSCEAMAAKMNAWGVAGCREHRAEIMEQLLVGYNAATVFETIAAGTMALAKGLPKSLDGMLDLAIERAEEKITTVTLNCELHGAGDAVTMAWVAEGSKGFRPEARLYAKNPAKRELLAAFGQEVTEDPDGAQNTFRAYANEVEGRGCGSRVLQRGRFLGFHSEPKRPHYLLKETDNALANLVGSGVLLFPCTADGTREWPPFYWLELYGLLDAAGLNPHFNTPIHDGRYAHLRCHHDYRWPEIMAAMLRSRAVVCNDSGPMHVAGTLDVLTFALLGPTNSACHNWMPSVVGLAATTDEIDCVGCYFGPPCSAACKSGCAALGHLLPAKVFASLIERLGHAPDQAQ